MIQENDALNFSFNLDFSQKSIQYNCDLKTTSILFN